MSNTPELEKLLYRLYIVLPAEGSNQHIVFMKQRLQLAEPLRPTLRSHQGLIQIREDFCLDFEQGCQGCGFPDLIGPGRSKL